MIRRAGRELKALWYRYPSTTLFLVYISVVVTLLLVLKVVWDG